MERHRYFGSPLEAVVDDDGVPIFVKKCVQIVEEKGLTLEGIYRVSGKKEDCLELQDKFDLGKYNSQHVSLVYVYCTPIIHPILTY